MSDNSKLLTPAKCVRHDQQRPSDHTTRHRQRQLGQGAFTLDEETVGLCFSLMNHWAPFSTLGSRSHVGSPGTLSKRILMIKRIL